MAACGSRYPFTSQGCGLSCRTGTSAMPMQDSVGHCVLSATATGLSTDLRPALGTEQTRGTAPTPFNNVCKFIPR